MNNWAWKPDKTTKDALASVSPTGRRRAPPTDAAIRKAKRANASKRREIKKRVNAIKALSSKIKNPKAVDAVVKKIEREGRRHMRSIKGETLTSSQSK